MSGVNSPVQVIWLELFAVWLTAYKQEVSVFEIAVNDCQGKQGYSQ